MKPQSFEYVLAFELDAALEELARAGDDAKVLAGGQSLVPAMNLRLAEPKVLVDINEIGELHTITSSASSVRVGTLVRHRELERAALGDPSLDGLLRAVARHIGYLPVRVRGSFGGSLAHADPAAEWCLVAMALGAEIELASAAGRRIVAIDDFLEGAYSTTLRPDEILVSATFARREGWVYGFAEHAPVRGAFALAGACVALDGRAGVVRAARVGVMGGGSRAERLPVVEAALEGVAPAQAPIVAGEATRASFKVASFGEVSHDYLRSLTGALVQRAIAQALCEVKEQ